jgi:integrase
VEQQCGTLPTLYEALDRLMCLYIEELWNDGQGQSTANYALAALHYFVPASRHQLKLAWRLVGAWKKLELPARAGPLSPLMLWAMVGFCRVMDESDLGTLLLVGYHCFLRTGEMVNLRRGDVQCDSKGKAISLKLEFTKGTARRGGTEFILIDDEVVQHRLGKLCTQRQLGELLVPMSIGTFYKFFRNMVLTLELADLNIKAYSLRRGGATFDFQFHNSLPRTLERGRWQHAKTARIYLMDGLMAWQSSTLARSTTLKLKTLARRGLS